jgi:hypothetical protein
MRPTNARYSPGSARNGSRPIGSPWYTVAAQAARGSGRRCASEIDTIGMSGNAS